MANWQSLLTAEEFFTLPWLGGVTLHSKDRVFEITGNLPAEHYWYTFKAIKAKQVKVVRPSDPGNLINIRRGYLVGNRFADEVTCSTVIPIAQVATELPIVHLLEDGLDRFTRISVGSVYTNGPLVYKQQEFPIGVEAEVLTAFYDGAESLVKLKGVTPAIDTAFRMERWYQAEAAKRRAELEELARLEALRVAAEIAKAEKERHRKELIEKVGDGQQRRELAKLDFAEAARAALAVGGAEYLDHRVVRGEYVVRYRFLAQRFECICDVKMRIIDAGVCLTSHDTGEKGDTSFSLESLPSVLREADRDHKLVVWRRG